MIHVADKPCRGDLGVSGAIVLDLEQEPRRDGHVAENAAPRSPIDNVSIAAFRIAPRVRAGREVKLDANQRGRRVAAVGAADVAGDRDEKRLLRFQKQLAKYKLLIIDELGFVPLSKTGAELLFEVFSQRYEGGSTLVTSNLPFDEWTEVFGSERLTGALLDRLTHHVHILEMNGDSYRLNQSQKRRKPPKT